MANNDGYIKVEDTLPPAQSGKSQEEIGWPTETQRKSLRTLGSFSNPQTKEITGIQEPVDISKKEQTELLMPIQTQYKEPSIFVEPSGSSSKDSVIVLNPPRLAKDQTNIDDSNIMSSKSSEIISDVVTNTSKNSDNIPESKRTNSKEEFEVSIDSNNLKKDSGEINADVAHDSKDEQIVIVNGVYRNKNGEPVAVFKDHLAKKYDDIKVDDDHGSKEETIVKAYSNLSKEEEEIDTNVNHKVKKSSDINVTNPSWTKKTIGDDLTSEIGSVDSMKADIVPEAITSLGSGTIDQNVHQVKTEYSYDEILSGYIDQVNKDQTEKSITASHTSALNESSGRTFNDASHIDYSKVSHVEKDKTTTLAYSTELGNKAGKTFDDILPSAIPLHETNSKVIIASHTSALNVSSNKTFDDTSHIDYSKVPHNAKDEPVILPYSTELGKTGKTFEDTLPSDIPVHILNPKEVNAGYKASDTSSVSGFDLLNADKSLKQAGLDNFDVSTSNVAVNYNPITKENDIEVKTNLNGKTSDYDSSGNYISRTSAKKTIEDAIDVSGFDNDNVGDENFNVGTSTIAVTVSGAEGVTTNLNGLKADYDINGDYTRVTPKTSDDIADNATSITYVANTDANVDATFLTRSTGKLSNHGIDARTSESPLSWIGIDDGKIEALPNTHDSSAPKVLVDGDASFTRVRNSDSYAPTYDLTNLIPPRVGLADVLKTITKAVIPSKYTSIPVFKPDMDNDLLRFGQRALTGEVARFIQSRLMDSVLKGQEKNFERVKGEDTSQLPKTVIDASESAFNILSGVTSALTANPMDLFRDKEELEYRGLLSGMGNQINTSASGIFGTMENYYNSVKYLILSKAADDKAKIAAAQKNIDDAFDTKRRNISALGAEYNKPVKMTTTGPGGEEEISYAPSKEHWDNLRIDRTVAARDRLQKRLEKLKIQYRQILIAFNPPTEYSEWKAGEDANKDPRFGHSWNVDLNRSIDGPKNIPVNSHVTKIGDDKSLDWRSFNLNRKPNSLDDFGEAGYLFDNSTKIIDKIKAKTKEALGEHNLFTKSVDAVVEDMFKMSYLLTNYNGTKHPFQGLVDEMIKYNYTIDPTTKSPQLDSATHTIPSEKMNHVYSMILNVGYKDNERKLAKYKTTTYNGRGGSSISNGNIPLLSDPHLTSLFEKQISPIIDPRLELYKQVISEMDAYENQIYMMDSTVNPEDVKSILSDGVFSKINYNGSDDDFYSHVPQFSNSISLSKFKTNSNNNSPLTKDEIARNKNILYQTSINYLYSNEVLTNRRNIRDNIISSNVKFISGNVKDLIEESDYSTAYSFGWYDVVEADGVKNKDLMTLFPELDSTINKYSTPNTITNTNINGLERQHYNITNYTDKDPEIMIKGQVEGQNKIGGRNTKKTPVPVAMSLVGTTAQKLKSYAIKNSNGDIEMRYAENPNGTAITKDTAQDRINDLNKVFIIDTSTAENETKRDTGDTSYYKTVIKAKRSSLDGVNNDNYPMTLKVAGDKDIGTIQTRGTNLGGILVSGEFAMDRKRDGSGSLYFEIPFQFNPKISGESRSANWNSVTAFGRTHEHFIYSNSGARSIQFQTSYAVLDSKQGEYFDKFGTVVADGSVDRNKEMGWAEGWTEDYVQMVLNMYRSLTLPISAYSAVTPPVIMIDFGKYLGGYNRNDVDKYVNARWVVSEYSIDPNLDAGYTSTKTPRLYDITLSLKEVYNGWHDLRDFYTIAKHLPNFENNSSGAGGKDGIKLFDSPPVTP